MRHAWNVQVTKHLEGGSGRREGLRSIGDSCPAEAYEEGSVSGDGSSFG